MKKTEKYLKNSLKLLFIFILISSCRTIKDQVQFTADKKQIYLGDTIKLTIQPGNVKKINWIKLNGIEHDISPLTETKITPVKDTTLEVQVLWRDKKVPIKKKIKIRVEIPEIIAFAAFRDRFDTTKVMLRWNVKGVESLGIEGLRYNLPLQGSDSLVFSDSRCFTLIAKTPFTHITKTCYVRGSDNSRMLIRTDTSMNELAENHRINMAVTETDIKNFPSEIKLKVIVYDTLGNFITHLAPPFGSDETAGKYFKNIVETVNDEAEEVEFNVVEIHESPALYDVAVTLDYSGSMTDYIDSLESATKYFIKEKYPDDYYSVVKYDDRLFEASPLLNGSDEIIKKAGIINMDSLGGSTAMYAGIDKGLVSLDNGKNQKVVILFTDGYENASLAYIGKYASTINEAVDRIRKENSKLYVIGMGDINKTLLTELTYYSNGSFYSVSRPEDLNQVYKDLLHNFRTYYEITIKPINQKGEHLIQLAYFDNLDSTTTQRPVYIGESIDFLKYEEDTTAYWYDKTLKNNKYSLATAPQALVNFDLDKDNIRKEFTEPLNNIAAFMKKNPGTIIKIYGHTDSRGSDEYNQQLSDKRSKAVFMYLMKCGISTKRMEWKGKGEKELLWKDDSSEWAAKENRRVEIVIWKK